MGPEPPLDPTKLSSEDLAEWSRRRLAGKGLVPKYVIVSTFTEAEAYGKEVKVPGYGWIGIVETDRIWWPATASLEEKGVMSVVRYNRPVWIGTTDHSMFFTAKRNYEHMVSSWNVNSY